MRCVGLTFSVNEREFPRTCFENISFSQNRNAPFRKVSGRLDRNVTFIPPPHSTLTCNQ
eukprot:m.562912 g.562912  ORF g.562912 m.562912 type:complete len:59 (-) comp57808_c0_seq21:295-471(-)